MSNIKCDICGGDIEMLPSKVGKCRNCGMEYSLDAIREIVKTNSVTVSPVQSESHMKVKPPSEELNRDALLLYLNDIRVMESVVSESNSKVVDLNEKLKEAKAELSAMSAVKKPVIPVEPSKESIMSDIKDKYFSPNFIFPSILIGIPSALFTIIITFSSLELDLLWIYLPCIISLLIIIFLWIRALIRYNSNMSDEINNYEYIYKKSLAAYNNDLDKYNLYVKIVDENSKDIALQEQGSLEQTHDINLDIEKTQKLLEKAYSVNIIPAQFRNIEGIYYLYDYISTSNQTLSEALMQCNLEAIKTRLEQMIQLQAQSVVYQAQQSAKLDEITQQNQELIKHAATQTNNTAMAARYAEIAAVNTSVTLELTSKQLAYQRADYWLK